MRQSPGTADATSASTTSPIRGSRHPPTRSSESRRPGCGSDLHLYELFKPFLAHPLPLEQAPDAYETFQKKQEDAIKIVFAP